MFKFTSVILALAVCVGVAFAGIDDDIKALDTKLESSIEKCMKSSGVADVDIKEAIEGKPLKNKVGCFLACIAKEFDILKANNMVDKDKVTKLTEPVAAKFKEEKMEIVFNEGKKIIESCLSSQQGGDDACVVFKTIAECVLSNAKKAGLYQ